MGEPARVRALAIDDDPQALQTFRRLEKHGIECRAILPPRPEVFPAEIFQPIEQGKIDVVLVDFILDAESGQGEKPASYRGGMLAAAIKERFPETPIVLVTTEEKHRRLVKESPKVRELFDHLLLKSEISGRPAQRTRAVSQIRALAEGFRRIREALRRPPEADPWKPLQRLLGIDSEHLEKLADRLGGSAPQAQADAVNWLLGELLAHPGPLLDAAEARSRLGLTSDSFEKESVQRWAESARYHGVFAELHPRWWESGLFELLKRDAGDAAFGEAVKRAAAIAAACGEKKLQAARCRWCGRGLVQRTCHVCKESVDATHHLVARVDARPVWALPAVVCFSCIATGRAEQDPAIRFGPGAHGLVEELKTSVR